MQKNFSKNFLSFLIMASMMCYLSSCSNKTTVKEKAANFEMTIVHTNDSHGRVGYDAANKYNGFSKIAAYVSNLRSEKKNVLLMDAGDTLHGQSIVTVSKGKTAVDLMNTMGYNYFTPGNHDFNYGCERLLELSKEMNCQVLAANVFQENGQLLFKPNAIYEINGAKVGIFGLCTPETLAKANPKYVKGLVFKDPVQIAKEQVSYLRNSGAQFIIALAHLGIDNESAPYRSYDVRDAVDGIDLIVDGHSHTELSKIQQVQGMATIVSACAYSEFLGVVDISMKDGVKSIVPKSLSFDELASQGSSPEVDDCLKKAKEEIVPLMSKVVGHTDIELDGKKSSVRTKETILTKMITEAIRQETNADAVIINGGTFRESIKIGDITMDNVISVLPFGNYIVTKSLTGQDIINALETGFTVYPEPAAAFPQIAGITCTLATNAPANSRVKSLAIGGTPVDLKKAYIVAPNDFVAAGGDDYEIFKNCKELKQYSGIDEIIVEYLSSISPIEKDIWPKHIIVQ